MKLLVIFWLTGLAVVGGFRTAGAGMLFHGGQVEIRAYSGFAPGTGTLRDTRTVELLPYEETAVVTANATVGQVAYSFTSGGLGGAFRWDFSLDHDGGVESYVVQEGEVAFEVADPIEARLAGSIDYLGPAARFAHLWLMDTPHDSPPVWEWKSQSSGHDGLSVPLDGSLLLNPEVTYRLRYVFNIDARNYGALGSATGDVEFLVGAPDPTTQPGDADGNGRVDLADLNLVRNNFGGEGPGIVGDTPPYDGRVDLADLNAVRNHFGQSLPQSVPEPGSLALALFSVLAGLTLSRGKRG